MATKPARGEEMGSVGIFSLLQEFNKEQFVRNKKHHFFFNFIYLFDCSGSLLPYSGFLCLLCMGVTLLVAGCGCLIAVVSLVAKPGV